MYRKIETLQDIADARQALRDEVICKTCARFLLASCWQAAVVNDRTVEYVGKMLTLTACGGHLPVTDTGEKPMPLINQKFDKNEILSMIFAMETAQKTACAELRGGVYRDIDREHCEKRPAAIAAILRKLDRAYESME